MIDYVEYRSPRPRLLHHDGSPQTTLLGHRWASSIARSDVPIPRTRDGVHSDHSFRDTRYEEREISSREHAASCFCEFLVHYRSYPAVDGRNWE